MNSSNTLSAPFSLSLLFLRLPQSMWSSTRWCCTGPLRSVHFSSSFLLSAPQIQIISTVIALIHQFFLLPAQTPLWIPQINSSFQLLYFWAPELLFSFIFTDIYIFVHILLSQLSPSRPLGFWAYLRQLTSSKVCPVDHPQVFYRDSLFIFLSAILSCLFICLVTLLLNSSHLNLIMW